MSQTLANDPNFPPDLDIHPLPNSSSDADARFDSTAQEGAIRTYGIAGRIWEASHAMLAYLDPSTHSILDIEFDPPPFTGAARGSPADEQRPITVLELGSGTGFVATRVAEWLRPDLDLLVATDLPDVCPMLDTNLRSCAAAKVRALPWGSREHASAILEELGSMPPSGRARQLTHVLCSDLVYFPALLAPLLRSILHLTSNPDDEVFHWVPPTVIISYKIRSLAKETPFWNAFGLWFEFSPVLSRTRRSRDSAPDQPTAPWNRFSPGDLDGEMFVLVATRRAESLEWIIPEDDGALLSGIGARGSASTKSDEQFEQLLLMGLEV
ncbi:hypothetical protein C8Q80DRAFT_1163279 [Daedaleopsis nitida]|nr:hypothetical protein C8Q80DRAFT_1163279 [Daedaleopsis nitida]